MTKISYASLKLKTNTDIKTFDFNGNKIEVLQYLPSKDKYDLLNITLQESKENGYYNPFQKDIFFHLNIVFMYTNITFTEKQKEDIGKLYDTFTSNGLLQRILENIPEEEYNTLYNYLIELEENQLKYNTTLLGTVNNLIQSIPYRADEINEIVNNFDSTKFQEVLDFAKAANGGRDIK